MRSLWLAALLLTTALAGCTGGQQSSHDAGPQVRVGLPAESVVAGQEALFRGLASGDANFTRWQWDLGDGTILEGRNVRHVYLLPGLYNVTLRAGDDEHFASHTVQIGVLDGAVPIPDPTLQPGDPGAPLAARGLRLADGEPTVGDDYRLVWDGPAGLNLTGQLTFFVDDVPQDHDVTGATAFELAAGTAGRQRIPWIFEGEDGLEQGVLVFDVWGEPIDFGVPTSEQWLRPGTQTVANGAQCTVNFLFHYKWYRFFIGSAAHCVDGADLDTACSSPTAQVGDKQTISAHDGRSVSTTLAYSSWRTMKDNGGGVCPANDFALYELGTEAQKVMHPAALFFGGPTEMAPEGGYGTGVTLYGYGASQLHGNLGVAYPGQDMVNSKRGVSLGTSDGGYYQHLYFALPGIPGDSGGPAFGPGGEALGVASVIQVAPVSGSNYYTVIPKALAYMQETEGWAPELVTYDRFTTSGI